MTEFEKIYRTYFKDVYHYIRNLSADEHIAEEIAGETFLKAMRSIDSFRGECDIRVWLCQIAKNCYYTHLKKSAKNQSLEEISIFDIPDPGVSVEEKISAKDEAAYIQKLLHDIPETYKEVFMWRVYANLSFRQIGQIFNKSENWACVTYHRARKMIISRMEADNK